MTELPSRHAPEHRVRDLLWPILALIAAGSFLVLVVAVIPTMKGAEHEAEHRLALARTALALRLDGVGRSVDAYGHMPASGVPRLGAAGAIRVDAGLARHLHDRLGYEMVFTIGAGTATGFVTDSSAVTATTADRAIEHGLAALVDAARSSDRPATGLVSAGGRPAAAAAIAMTASREPPGEADRPAEILVLVDLLDEAALAEIAAGYRLGDLALGAPDRPERATLPLVSNDGHPLGVLTWRREDLTESLGGQLLAVLVLALIAPALCTFSILRRSHRRSLAAASTAASALRLSEARFRDFAEAASDWLWETDAEGRFTYLSGRHQEVTGIDPASRLGRTRWEIGLPAVDNDPDKWDGLRRDLEERRPIRDFRFRVVNPQGRLMHLRITGRPVHDEAGAFVGYRGTGSDITAEVDAVAALRASEARFRDFAEAASDWLWETDAAGRFTYFSERHKAVLGVDTAARLGRTRWELGLPEADNDPAKWAALRRDLDEQQPVRDFRYRIHATDGRLLHIRINGKPVYDEAGTFAGYRGTGSDITTEVEAAERARHLAFHDALTGLPNRLLFMERLEMATAAAVRHAALTAVLCIDLDHFKEVNDTRGHAAGDQVLVGAAQRLLDRVRTGDTVARLGGDEFAIVQTGVESLADVQALCQRLIEAFAEPFVIDCQPSHLGLSIGVALAPVDAESPADLLRHADLALYRAKSEGRGEFRLFEPLMDAQLQARKQLENDLRRALERNEFLLEYQPQLELASGRITSIEALVRWRHPEHGLLSPATFIPIAEQTGLILPLGEWVLREACRQAAGWGSEIRVSVNLSPVQVHHRNVVEQIAAVLRETRLPAARLELEVTEGVLLKDTEQALGVLEALKEMGVHIAMDDFGTGYSSLNYLQRFPFDKLKIDGSFVRDLFVSSGSAAIIRAVIGLGRGLGISVTAEGVETEAQLSFLEREGCVAVQGFHLGRPMRPELLAARLADQQPAPASSPAAAGRNHGLAEAASDYLPGGVNGTDIARQLGLVQGSLWLPAVRPAAGLTGCSRPA